MATQDFLSGASGVLTSAATGAGLTSGLLAAGASASAAGPIGWAVGGLLALAAGISAGINSNKRKEYGEAQLEAMKKNRDELMEKTNEQIDMEKKNAEVNKVQNDLGLRAKEMNNRNAIEDSKNKLKESRLSRLDNITAGYKNIANPTANYKSRLTQSSRWA